jgi:hypothetical protein
MVKVDLKSILGTILTGLGLVAVVGADIAPILPPKYQLIAGIIVALSGHVVTFLSNPPTLKAV